MGDLYGPRVRIRLGTAGECQNATTLTRFGDRHSPPELGNLNRLQSHGHVAWEVERVRRRRVDDRSAQTDGSGPRQCHRGRGSSHEYGDAADGGEDEGDVDRGLAREHCSEVRDSSRPSYRCHCLKRWDLMRIQGGNRVDTNSPKRFRVGAGTCCLRGTG